MRALPVTQRVWETVSHSTCVTRSLRTIPGVRPATSLPSAQSSPIRTFSIGLPRQYLQKPPQHTTSSSTATSLLRQRTNQQRIIRPEWRRVSTSSPNKAEAKQAQPRSYQEELRDDKNVVDQDEEDEGETFKRSEKADQAAQLNLSAKLSKEGTSSGQAAGWQEIWRLLTIARPEVKSLSWAFLFLLISSSISMSIPFSIGRILDIATKPPGEGTELFGLNIQSFYLALGGVLAVGAAANYGRIIILRIVGERVVTRLRSQLFRKTFVQNAEFFDANRIGDLISRLGSDTIIVGKSITQNVSDGLRSFVSAGAGFALMSYVSLKLTGILALMFPPVAIGAFLYGRVIRNLSRRIQKNLGTLTKIAEERLGNVRTSQAFAGEIQEVHRYNSQVRRIFELGKTEAYYSATFFSLSGFMGNMTFIALLYVGGGMVKSGAISIGDLTSFLMYTAYAGSSLFGLSAFYSELMKGVGAASRLFELQDREPTISLTKGVPVNSARGNITFEKVAFSYPTRPAVKIFNDLDFTIQHGTNVAIVAPSGAGKSTVASLLLRFYSPTSGRILIGGNNILEMNVKQLRRKIGYVGQEPVLFSGTIAENIAYGRPAATRSEISTAAKQANCQFISDFVSHCTLKSWILFTDAIPLAGGTRDVRWSTRNAAIRWPEAAHCHCSSAAQESRYPDFGRSDQCLGCRVRDTRQPGSRILTGAE